MKNFYEILKDNPLFKGITADDFERMLDCLSARKDFFNKDEIILLSGDTVNYVGLILSGSVKIMKEDINGRVSIIACLGTSELFGEVFVCAGIEHSPVTVQAAENTKILFIDYKRIVTSCTAACAFHSALIANMLKLVASKNLLLNQKIEILSKRTTREKLLAFFDTYRGTAKEFSVPFNREEMARYICVDRSSMSSELGRMRDEGLISFKGNIFKII